MNYHDQLIEAFCQHLGFYERQLGFSPNRVRRNVRIGNGDIDILLQDEMRKAVIEVKAHDGLLPKFLHVQLPKYQAYFPAAEFYSLTGTADKSLDPRRLNFRRHA